MITCPVAFLYRCTHTEMDKTTAVKLLSCHPLTPSAVYRPTAMMSRTGTTPSWAEGGLMIRPQNEESASSLKHPP